MTIGNLKGLKTFIPNQDEINNIKKLEDLRTLK